MRVPLFCVSLAYAEHGKPLLGVIYDPMRDECFFAERGQGAYLNDEPIQVSATTELLTSLLMTGFPYDRFTDSRNNLAAFAAFHRPHPGRAPAGRRGAGHVLRGRGPV